MWDMAVRVGALDERRPPADPAPGGDAGCDVRRRPGHRCRCHRTPVAGEPRRRARVRIGPLQLAENFQCLQVRLSPVIARAVLGASPADLNGAVVALDDLWGRQASRTAEQLADAFSWEDRFALTDALLARRRETGPPADPEVAWAWNQIVDSRGRARVEALADDLGWSRKRLGSRFHSQSGLPPKRAAKLVRFDMPPTAWSRV